MLGAELLLSSQALLLLLLLGPWLLPVLLQGGVTLLLWLCCGFLHSTSSARGLHM
jgi:hypothetical protein